MTRTHGLPRAGHASFRPMRLHITLDDALVHEIDRRAGPRRRSAFIAELIRRGLETDTDQDEIDGGNPQARDGAGMP